LRAQFEHVVGERQNIAARPPCSNTATGLGYTAVQIKFGVEAMEAICG
jgi:hypothetical protein